MSTLPQNGLLTNVKSRLHLAKSSQRLNPIIYQTSCSRVETLSFGVPKLHHLLVIGLRLLDSCEDQGLHLWRDFIPHDGLLIQILQAGLQKEKTLVR